MRARVVGFWLVCAVLLAGVLAVTAARLVDPSDRWGIALVAFTPLALPGYAVVLLLAGIRLAVVRRWRGAALPVALVAVAGLVLHGWWYAPQLTGSNPPPAAGSTPVVVMTANLWVGSADGAEVVRTAADRDVDLLVVQEVTAAVLAEMDRAGLADLLPYRVGRADSPAADTMAFSRTPLTDPVQLPGSMANWGFTMGDLRVLAVHPTYPVHAAAWADSHAAIAGVVAEQRPDLIVGDFNATMDHRPMRDLVDRGYRDVGELANDGWNATWPVAGPLDPLGRVPLIQIDHVLVGPRLAALGMSTVSVPDTDHRALVARVAAK